MRRSAPKGGGRMFRNGWPNVYGIGGRMLRNAHEIFVGVPFFLYPTRYLWVSLFSFPFFLLRVSFFRYLWVSFFSFFSTTSKAGIHFKPEIPTFASMTLGGRAGDLSLTTSVEKLMTCFNHYTLWYLLKQSIITGGGSKMS